jgi:alcohol dehydrogenase/S-(hydroxymethyl)glutathione dehydrogenase/alcohol dehydrogenase
MRSRILPRWARCQPSVPTAELAFDVLATGGTATILGLMPEGERLSISADALVYGDRVLRGAYMGANRFLSDV